MSHWSFLVMIVIVTALAFDFTNGFHDTANAMATSVATGALPPRVAVGISGILNLVGVPPSPPRWSPAWSRWWRPTSRT